MRPAGESRRGCESVIGASGTCPYTRARALLTTLLEPASRIESACTGAQLYYTYFAPCVHH